MLQLVPLLLFLSSACTLTSKPIESKKLGEALRADEIPKAFSQPGPIRFQKVLSSDWTIYRSGLLNLNDPKAADLKDGDEEIQIYFYVLDHPTYGRFLVDSGISHRMKADLDKSPFGGLVGRILNVPSMKMHRSTREWWERFPGPIAGLFFTHMHFDHMMGIVDLPEDMPLYAGPREASRRSFRNFFTLGMTDDLLKGERRITELQFPPEGTVPSALDFFGDRSLLVFWVPGHTPGSLAFLLNSTEGPQLIVGDSSHTRWGWENGVAPGSFSEDLEKNQVNLNYLRALSAQLGNVRVHPGHQSTGPSGKLESFPSD